jgi:hypothetical protein
VTDGAHSAIGGTVEGPDLEELIAGSKTMFKIEVFNALQTPFGLAKYTSLKIALQNANPIWK